MTDFRALCAELVAALKEWTEYEQPCTTEDETDLAQARRLVQRAYALLAQPEPQGPTDEELEDFALQNGGGYFNCDCQEEADILTRKHMSNYRAVLTRWGRPAIEPVPVSEGMPGPEDVNDDGEVWVEEPAYDYPLGDTGDYDSEPGRWVLKPLSSLDKRFKRRWLPHSALPVPGVEGADG
jgi:hypothetical protein